MRHRCKVTVLATPCDEGLQREYLADPEAGPCPVFHVGEEFLFEREGDRDDFWHFGADLDPRFPCAEAWDCISRSTYTALQGGTPMRNWCADERVMIASCNDGTRPVVFKIERIDVPDTPEDEAWLASHDFTNRREGD